MFPRSFPKMFIKLVTLFVSLLPTALVPAVAQTDKQAPPPPKAARPNSTGSNSNIPACSKFQDWRYGQECRRDDGKTCQVMGQRADPGELKFCK